MKTLLQKYCVKCFRDNVSPFACARNICCENKNVSVCPHSGQHFSLNNVSSFFFFSFFFFLSKSKTSNIPNATYFLTIIIETGQLLTQNNKEMFLNLVEFEGECGMQSHCFR